MFSKPKVVANEPLVEKHVQKLAERMDSFANRTTHSAGESSVLNLGAAFTAMTMDIITEYMMGRSYNNLAVPDFNEGMMGVISNMGKTWRTAKHLPWILPILTSMPHWIVATMDEKTGLVLDFLDSCSAHAKEVVSTYQTDTIRSAYKDKFIHQILSHPALPPSEKSLQRLSDDLQTAMGAGFETTAQVLRVFTFHVYSNASMLTRLRSELAHRPSDTNLDQLPYLTAAITEALRLSPGVATRQARVSPSAPIQYCGWTIPPGTPVGMTTLLLHHDPGMYPDPKRFDPSRWLADPPGKEVEMGGRCFAPFGRGTRMCLGMHLAWLELYRTVAMLVMNYDLEFVGTTIEDVECRSDCFAVGTTGKTGVKVTVRRVGESGDM